MALGPCRECGQQVSDQAPSCPYCGVPAPVQAAQATATPLLHVEEQPRARRRILVMLLAAALLLVAAGVGVALKVRHDDHVRAQKAAAVAKQKREAAEAKAAADEAERERRSGLVDGLEGSITADANKRIAAGDLDPPKVSQTDCTPVGGGSTDDLTALTGAFTCIAVNKENPDGTYEGWRYSGTINYKDESWTWHLGG